MYIYYQSISTTMYDIINTHLQFKHHSFFRYQISQLFSKGCSPLKGWQNRDKEQSIRLPGQGQQRLCSGLPMHQELRKNSRMVKTIEKESKTKKNL